MIAINIGIRYHMTSKLPKICLISKILNNILIKILVFVSFEESLGVTRAE